MIKSSAGRFLQAIRRGHTAGHYLPISKLGISIVVWLCLPKRLYFILTFEIQTLRHRKVKKWARVSEPEIKLISSSSTGSPLLPSHPNCHTSTTVKGISEEEINFIVVLLFESMNRLSIRSYNLSVCDHWLQVYEMHLNGLHEARKLNPSMYGTHITKLCKAESADYQQVLWFSGLIWEVGRLSWRLWFLNWTWLPKTIANLNCMSDVWNKWTQET